MEILWIAFAFALGLGVRFLGLPPLVGYLIAGFGLNAFGAAGGPQLEHLAEIGVLLLLFSVGLKLRLRSLARAEVLVGTLIHMAVSVVVIGVAFYALGGFASKTAALIAFALSFSSTVVAAKVLEQKKELRAFHGRVAIGILVMQDVAAVAFLSFGAGGTLSPWALLILAIPLLRPLIHRLFEASGHDELLVLFGLLLALVVGGAGFHYVGLSAELGALLLGALLSEHPRAQELSNALWGLKEILLVGFFLQIGMAGLPTFETSLIAVLMLLFMPIKAALFFFVLLGFRLRARNSFLTALALATYSEFGLIVADMAVDKGWLDPDWLVTMALAVALSFVLAAPFNRRAHALWERFGGRLQRLESTQRHPDDEPISLGSANIMIMGMGRVGTGAYEYLTQRNLRVIGLDSDPGKMQRHRAAHRRVLYADAEDQDFWNKVKIDGLQAVLLALPDPEANAIAVRQLRKRGYAGLISAVGVFPEHVQAIKDAGADLAYNYYEGAGAGFAGYVLDALNSASSAGSGSPGTSG